MTEPVGQLLVGLGAVLGVCAGLLLHRRFVRPFMARVDRWIERLILGRETR